MTNTLHTSRAQRATNTMRSNSGFTLIEIMVVLAVIAILLTFAVPTTHHRVIQGQVKESINLLERYQKNISDYYQATGNFPANNKALGLPEANKIIGNYLSQAELKNGALHLTLGNKVHKLAASKVVTLRPVYVAGSPASPISWICGYDDVPSGMTAAGENQSNIDVADLPIACR